MKRSIRNLITALVVIMVLVSSLAGTVYASNWTSSGNTSGWSTTSWSYVAYGYNAEGQYYAQRYENGSLVQDIRARGTNLWNQTYQVLISAYALNRSSTDLAIDVNGNVYGVDASTSEPLRYDNGYEYPVRLSGYYVQTGTPFLLDSNGFCTGIYTTSGLLDLSGNLVSSSSGYNPNYNTNPMDPPAYGDGPGSSGWNGEFGNAPGYYYDDDDYPYVSTTSVSSSTKTYYKSSNVYYTYKLSSGKLYFTKNGGSSSTTVRSSSVVAFAFTDDGYVNYVYKSGSYYYGVEIKVGSSSGASNVFSKADDYVLKVDSDGFVSRFEADDDDDDDDEDYPYFSPTTNSSTTRTYYKTSSTYYKYTISSSKLKFYKNGSSSATTIDTDDYEGSVVYFSFTDEGEVIMVTKSGSYYYAYLLDLGKSSVSETIFEDSKSYSVTKDSDGFVTKISSASKSYSL